MGEEATATLRLDEAVELAHALLTRLAEIQDVRILFIKGPTAVQMGARPPRPSSDVDVLCEPEGVRKLGAALERCGWRRRVPEEAKQQFVYAARYLFDHSVHYIHDDWPCDLDLHYNFPGFFAPEEVVFEALWVARATTEVANWQVACADFLGQALIVGLHALREPDATRNQMDLGHLVSKFLERDAGTTHAFAMLASATGSMESLRPLVQRIGAPEIPGPWVDAEALRRWNLRAAASGVPTTTWWIELRLAPLRQRPGLMRRALFPSAEHFEGANVGTAMTKAALLRLRTGRLVRAVPHAIRGMTRARHLIGRGS